MRSHPLTFKNDPLYYRLFLSCAVFRSYHHHQIDHWFDLSSFLFFLGLPISLYCSCCLSRTEWSLHLLLNLFSIFRGFTTCLFDSNWYLFNKDLWCSLHIFIHIWILFGFIQFFNNHYSCLKLTAWCSHDLVLSLSWAAGSLKCSLSALSSFSEIFHHSTQICRNWKAWNSPMC